MIRGTTPTLEFTLPFDTSLLAEAYVTLSQNRKVVIDRELASCECEADKLIVKLSQEETLKLESENVTEIQIRVRTAGNEALASQIIAVNTGRILKDGEI